MRTSHLSKITIKTYTDEWHTAVHTKPLLAFDICDARCMKKNACKLACEQIAKMPVQSKQSK